MVIVIIKVRMIIIVIVIVIIHIHISNLLTSCFDKFGCMIVFNGSMTLSKRLVVKSFMFMWICPVLTPTGDGGVAPSATLVAALAAASAGPSGRAQ